MKTILTLLFVLFIGLAAQAQSAVEDTQVKVETIEMGIVTSTSYEKTENDNKTEVARLYKFKNSRIKKALKFTTKRNKAKMA
ncbi:MAG: hypothetical protein ABJN95_19930 [Maribacter sp.]|uniref:hypothetical protein n=1 Tax=Maribacter sp. TaxID=1897614 RepID=UPI00329860DD